MELVCNAGVELAVLGLSGGELVIFAVIALVLFGANKIPPFIDGLGRGIREYKRASRNVQNAIELPEEMHGAVADALTHSNTTVEFVMKANPDTSPNERSWRDKLVLFVAQGFGIGRLMPSAPGTWGSLVGLFWCGLLLKAGSLEVFVLGGVAGVFASVWFCGEAEQILKQKDPPSVVLDEIVAMPLCFIWLPAWCVYVAPETNPMPNMKAVEFGDIITIAIVFGLFRFFDIAKPWPVKQSQSLPGGWGVVVDDVLAAVYVNIAMLAVYFVSIRLHLIK